MVVANVTGWNELVNGSVVNGVYKMYDAAFGGWFVVILFFIFQFMLYMKTKSLTACFVTTTMFVAMFAGTVYIKSASMYLMVAMLAIELGGIIYFTFFKRG